MNNGRRDYGKITLFEERTLVRLKRGVLPFILAVFLIIGCLVSGVGMGRPELFETAINDLDNAEYLSGNTVMIGDESLTIASAATNRDGGTANQAHTSISYTGNVAKTYQYSYSVNASNALRFYYYEDSAGSDKFSAGSGTLEVKADRNLPIQKTQLVAVGVWIQLNGTLGTLQAKGLLNFKGMSCNVSRPVNYAVDTMAGYYIPAKGETPGSHSRTDLFRNCSGNSNWTPRTGENKWNNDYSKLPGKTNGVRKFLGYYWDTAGPKPLSDNVTVKMGDYSPYIFVWAAGLANYRSRVGGRLPSVKISDIKLNFESTDNAAPTATVNSETTAKWAANYKTVKINVSDNSTLIDTGASSASFINNNGSTVTSGTLNGTTYTYTNVRGPASNYNQNTTVLTVTYGDKSGNKLTNKGFTLNDLRIDRTAPNFQKVIFRPSGNHTTTELDTGQSISSPTRDNVDLLVKINDDGSGVNTVSARNNTTGETRNLTKYSGKSYSSSSPGSLDGAGVGYWSLSNVTNGSYTITATDGAGLSTTFNTQFYYQDKQAPEVSVRLTDRYGNNLITSASNYANDYIQAIFTVVDGADPNNQFSALYSNSSYNAARRATGHGITVSYNGGAFNVTPTITQAATATTSYNSSTGKVTAIYTVILPIHGGDNLYSFTVTDNAGNTVSRATVTNDGNRTATALGGYIDTSAPRVQSLTGSAVDFSSKAGSPKWTKNNLVLNLSVSDIPSVSGVYATNNTGSGLRYVIMTAYDHDGNVVSKYTQYKEWTTKNINTDTVSFNITANYNEVRYYKFAVIDWAGNSSATISWNGTNYTELQQRNATYGGVTSNPYYINQGGEKDIYIYKDSNPVSVVLLDDKGNELVLTEGDEYVYPWSKAASIDFKVRATFGPSGGKLIDDINNSLLLGDYTNNAWGANEKKDLSRNGANVVTIAKTEVSAGKIDHRYRFESGMGDTVKSGNLVTCMDRTPPTAKLIGFGSGFNTSGSYRTEADIIASISGFVSEENLFNSVNWYGYGSGNGKISEAYFLLSDGEGSGVSGDPQFGYESQAKAKITFNHNGYTYTKTSNYYEKQGDFYLLRVPMWDVYEIGENAQNSAGTKMNASGKLDALYGQNKAFSYAVEVSDFIGNTTTQIKVQRGENKQLEDIYELSYKVDPFDIDAEIRSIKTADGKDYDFTKDGRAWTRQDIIITIEKTQLGLSSTTIYYYDGNTIKDTPAASGIGMQEARPIGGLGDTDVNGVGWKSFGDGGSSTIAQLTLSATTSRSIQLFFIINNSAMDKPFWMFYDSGKVDPYVFIRQDVDVPTISGVFFSTNGNIAYTPNETEIATNLDILLYYYAEQEKDGDGNIVYSLRRDIRRDGRSAQNIWIDDEVYMYIIASDYNGVGLGSGIDFIKITYDAGAKSKEELLYTDNRDGIESSRVYFNEAEPYDGLYRSNLRYGYDTATELFGFRFSIADKQANDSEFNVTRDTENRKILPIVDKEIPSVVIESAIYGADNSSYLGADKRFAGDLEHAVKNDISVSFRYTVGISDAKLYIRLRDFGEYLDGGDSIVVNNSDRASGTRGFVRYSGIDFSEWTEVTDGKTVNGSTVASGGSLWNYIVKADGATIKNRYDILLVANNGLYYYMDGGDVFIDTVAPEIDDSKTFYSLADNEHNGDKVIDYTLLDIVGKNDYTNGDVYVYFRIEDTGSGVDRVYYPKADGDIGLERVTVKRETDGKITEDEHYYRMLLTESNNYKIKAIDKAGNEIESAAFTPNIDKSAVILSVSSRTASGSQYNSGVFTNDMYVEITLSVVYGTSGFSEVRYSLDGITYTVLSAANLLNKGGWTVGATRAEVTFTISAEQKQNYTFVAYNNVLPEHSALIDGERTRPSDKKEIKVCIDRSAPVIYADDEGSNLSRLVSVWRGYGEVLTIMAKDQNEAYGSGIEKIKIDYALGGNAQKEVVFNDLGDGYYDTDGFTLDYYVDYTITLTDRAGNATTFVVLPKIDTFSPTFKETNGNKFSLMKAASVSETDLTPSEAYTAGEWVNVNVFSILSANYSISGARLEYARASKNGATFGAWTTWSGGEFPWNGEIAKNGKLQTASEDNFKMNFTVPYDGNFDYTYKIRLASTAGRYSEELVLGEIMIDKVKPNIEVDVRINGNNTDYGRKDGNKTIIDGWTQNDIFVNLASDSDIKSGYSIYYNVNQGAEDWQRITLGFTSNVNFDFNYAAQTLVHRINSSTNNETYKYFIESNSGMRSEVYTVEGIKIDGARPVGGIRGEVSDKTGTAQGGGKLNLAAASDYTGNVALNYNFMDPKWISNNAVILRVQINNVSYSGLSLYIDGILYEQFSHTTNEIYRYFAITESGTYTVRLVSGAGIANEFKATVNIDNSIPVMFVKGIDGNTSTNWNEQNGSDSPDWEQILNDCWYTSVTGINFAVGTLVKGADGYVYSADKSPSGFSIEYTTSTDADEDDWEWISNGASTVLTVIGNPLTMETYRFRIVSNSGMTFTLGKNVVDNMGNVVAVPSDIKDMVNAEGGMVKHLSKDDFVYNVNVDSNVYYINVERLLELSVRDRDVLVSDVSFADYAVEKFVNGAWVELSGDAVQFSHGDLVKVKYRTNDYIHRYTEYGVTDADGNWSAVEVYEGTDENETEGEFTFRFNDSNLRVKAYFMKELEVGYANTVTYLQSQSEAAVTARTSYSYRNENGATERVDIPLDIKYTDMDGREVDVKDLSLGGYVVTVSVSGKNASSFRLANPQTVLLVKYFTERTGATGNVIPNSASAPYTVYNQKDLSYISANYYKDYEVINGKFVLGEACSYLDGHYALDGDMALDTDFGGIEGVFKGSFNGEGHTVTVKGGEKNGSYGFFKSLAGTVDELVIKVDGAIILREAGDVGILAAVINGGTVGSVRVSGEIEIVGVTAGAAIGGLAGRVENAIIGGNGDRVYTDVTIENNGKTMDRAYIGGLVGYVGDGSVITDNYVYPHITIYNVPDEVKIGAVFGDAEVTEYTGGNEMAHYLGNRYFKGNVFVNDAVRSGFIGTASNINDEAESKNTVRGVGFVELTGLGNGQLGTVSIMGAPIRQLVLDKLYEDFGIDHISGEYTQGTGAIDNPMVIDTLDKLRAIDGYMNLNYVLANSLDLEGFGKAIGLHKVFAGSFNGRGNKLTSFGKGFDIADGDRIGLFAELSGTVKDVIMTDVSVEYAGAKETVYAGVVAAKLNGGTIGNIISIGNVDLVSNGGAVYAAGISGYADGGTVYDIFSIVNVKVTAAEAVAGGIIGYAKDTRVGSFVNEDRRDTVGPVFALGRVEAYSESPKVGAVYADGSLTADNGAIFAIASNAYSNGIIVNRSLSSNIKTVAFDNVDMRNTAFSDGTNIFNKVFKTDGLYYLGGSGISTDKFTVTNAEEFAHIEHMLYASYNIANEISFTNFKTIGVGLKFSGSIDGKTEDSWSAEDGTVSSLMNVTDALVYDNAGSITDLGINVYYNRTVEGGDHVFGAIAVYNSTGTIRNVTVSGEINITSVNKNSTVTVSGFVGIATGGVLDGDSKVQNSISGLTVNVKNAGTVYAGGYIGRVDGLMTLSYGIGNGSLTVTDCGIVFAGTLVGAAYKECDWTSLEETEDYRYEVTIRENGADRKVTDLFGYKAV